jgi:hypothetical protein
MRKHIILFFSALLFLFACKGDKTPDDVIKDKVMIRLLTDIHLVDGSLYDKVGVDSLYKYGTSRYQYVFKKYHTDTGQFKRSLKYYTTEPGKLMAMYDTIGKILQKKTDSINKIKIKVKDTAAKVKAKPKDTIKVKKDTLNKKIKFKKHRKHKNALPQ